MLELKNVNAGYGELQVLYNISLKVEEGEFISLVGPNGAGKTTTLRTISGIIKPISGEIDFLDNKIETFTPQQITRQGVSFVTEDGCLFPGMSIKDNLEMGAYIIKDKEKKQENLEYVFNLFPRLAERKKQLAGTLSGGERKMLSIARGLMSNPQVLLVDEPSLGLAPQLVSKVFETLKRLNDEGVTILLVEQNVNTALKLTDRTYVLEQGEIALSGPSSELLQDDHVKNSYLGIRERE